MLSIHSVSGSGLGTWGYNAEDRLPQGAYNLVGKHICSEDCKYDLC